MTYPTYTRAEDAGGVSSIALPVFDRLPSKHMLVEIDGNYHYPTLLKGDQVVVDMSDKELVEGELYAIQQSRGPHVWQVCFETPERAAKREHPERPCAWLHPLNRKSFEDAMREADERRIVSEGVAMIPILDVHLSDGPIYVDALKEQVIGRVVGMFKVLHPVELPRLAQ